MSELSAYSGAVGRGRLRLGGVAVERKSKASKKKKKKKKKKKRDREGEAGSSSSATVASSAAALRPTRQRGSGRLVTSGTSVMGHEGTNFITELAVGDAVIVQHPTSLTEEARIVRMVLSDISISISSAFSSDLITATRFEYITAPKKEVDESAAVARKRTKRANDEDAAFGTFAGKLGTVVTYRERVPGAAHTYRIVTKKSDRAMSRGELLDLRAKKKSDRFC